MATKDNFLLFEKKHKSFNYCHTDTGAQYFDLNLKQNLKGSNIFPIQSNSKSYNNKKIDYTLSEIYEEKEKSKIWKKSSATDISFKYSNTSSLNDENEKCWKKNATNNSTLSFHISAYENSNEASSDSLNSFQKSLLIQKQKQINPASKFVSQSPFEFQRQQNDKIPEPEVSQFKASQRLLNSNKSDLHSLKMSEIDHLFDVRNNYYLGAFQQCINDAQNARVKSDADKMSRDAFLYRSYIALGKTSIPLNEINQSTASTALKAVRRFAEYIADPKKRSKIASEVAEEVNGNIDPEDTNLLMIANILIRQNVIDLAIREWKKMQEINEDATITQLALAWVNMAAGKEKLQEAFYIYQEMIDKYGATPYLQVSQASSLIQQGKYSEAEKLLLDAQQRDANDPDIIINLLTVSQFLGKAPEVSNRFINQLTEEYADHPWVVDYLNKEKLFERLAESSTA